MVLPVGGVKFKLCCACAQRLGSDLQCWTVVQDFWTLFFSPVASPLFPPEFYLCRINNFHVKCLEIWTEKGCKFPAPWRWNSGLVPFPWTSESGGGTARSCCFLPHFWRQTQGLGRVQRGDLMPQPFPPEPRCCLPAAKLEQDWGSVPQSSA